jgi:hypothetical protein
MSRNPMCRLGDGPATKVSISGQASAAETCDLLGIPKPPPKNLSGMVTLRQKALQMRGPFWPVSQSKGAAARNIARCKMFGRVVIATSSFHASAASPLSRRQNPAEDCRPWAEWWLAHSQACSGAVLRPEPGVRGALICRCGIRHQLTKKFVEACDQPLPPK